MIRPIEYIGANVCPECKGVIKVLSIETLEHYIDKKGSVTNTKVVGSMSASMGMCCTCKKKFPLLETVFGFVHDSEFNRWRLFKQSVASLSNVKSSENPMLKNGGK